MTEWLGNTPSVATKHYLQVTDEHFQRAVDTKGGATGGAEGGEVVQQVVPSATGEDCQRLTETQKASGLAAISAVFPEAINTYQVPPQGLEHSPEAQGKQPVSETSGATVGAMTGAYGDQRLETLIALWPSLSESVRDELHRIAASGESSVQRGGSATTNAE